eukprot:Platyproteum_vivax@DN1866_c0_g1_i1.p1
MTFLPKTPHQFMDMLRNVGAKLTPVNKESQFVQKGTLTPDEFVSAGDQLVYKFPSWEWSGVPDSKYEVNWLPPDKQFLITRNVPCACRIRDLDHGATQHTIEGDWNVAGDDDQEADESQPDDTDDRIANSLSLQLDIQEDFLNFSDLQSTQKDQAASQEKDRESESEEGELVDIAAIQRQFKVPEEEDAACIDPIADAPMLVRTLPNTGDGIGCSSMRRYDLSVTYDKFYATPRLWLFGYDEQNKPLTPEQVFEDVMSQYQRTTTTVDPHPCTALLTLSIHPCKHAAVMKKVNDRWIAAKKEPRPDLSLFVFLKFISGVVPTINYDFTTNIDM